MILNFYRESFEPKMLTKLADALNGDAEKITIYFSSNGGKNSVAEAATDLVNSNKERFEVIAYDYIGSNGFKFFIEIECEKRVLPNTLVMHHQVRTSIDVDEFNKPYYQVDRAQIERMKFERKDMDEFNRRIGLTASELRKFNRNDDVYFHYDRLLELIENYKNNK